MKVRLAVIEDVPRLIELGRLFCAESTLGWSLDPEMALTTITAMIQGDTTATIVVDDDDNDVVGVVNMMAGRDYHVQEIGFIEKFYVVDCARRTPAARLLVRAAIEWFAERGCAAVFATATANINPSQDKQFENLFAKFGFVPCGVAMIKEFINEQV